MCFAKHRFPAVAEDASSKMRPNLKVRLVPTWLAETRILETRILHDLQRVDFLSNSLASQVISFGEHGQYHVSRSLQVGSFASQAVVSAKLLGCTEVWANFLKTSNLAPYGQV